MKIKDRELRTMIAAAESQGCSIRRTGSGHIQVLIPNGGIVLVSSTPSDARAVRNARGDLRRAGLDL